jgi:hypothetical protein
VIPFFAYPPEVRTIIYTTNAIESLHMPLRKIVKNRGHFPSDEAATKLLFLALRNIEKNWKMPQRTWKQVIYATGSGALLAKTREQLESAQRRWRIYRRGYPDCHCADE